MEHQRLKEEAAEQIESTGPTPAVEGEDTPQNRTIGMSDGEDDLLWRLVVRRRLSHDGAAARVSITKDTKPQTASGQRVLGSSTHTVYKGSL